LSQPSYRFKVESGGEQATTMELRGKRRPPMTHVALVRSGDGTDYYFIYGPELDEVVAGYRRSYRASDDAARVGVRLWQSRQRYETSQQSLDVVDEFRRAAFLSTTSYRIVVLAEGRVGSHQFDPERSPTPTAGSNHPPKARAPDDFGLGQILPGTANFEAMQTGGFLYQLTCAMAFATGSVFPYTMYDAFNPAGGSCSGRKSRPRCSAKASMRGGWMPPSRNLRGLLTLESHRSHMQPVAMGTASRVMNAYP